MFNMDREIGVEIYRDPRRFFVNLAERVKFKVVNACNFFYYGRHTRMFVKY